MLYHINHLLDWFLSFYFISSIDNNILNLFCICMELYYINRQLFYTSKTSLNLFMSTTLSTIKRVHTYFNNTSFPSSREKISKGWKYSHKTFLFLQSRFNKIMCLMNNVLYTSVFEVFFVINFFLLRITIYFIVLFSFLQ